MTSDLGLKRPPAPCRSLAHWGPGRQLWLRLGPRGRGGPILTRGTCVEVVNLKCRARASCIIVNRHSIFTGVVVNSGAPSSSPKGPKHTKHTILRIGWAVSRNTPILKICLFKLRLANCHIAENSVCFAQPGLPEPFTISNKERVHVLWPSGPSNAGWPAPPAPIASKCELT